MSRAKQLRLILAFSVVSLLALWYANLEREVELPEEFAFLQNSNDKECHLRPLDPFDPSIQQYIDVTPQKLVCRPVQDTFAKLEANRIRILKPEAKCRFRTMEHNSGVNDFSVKYGDWTGIDGDASPPLSTDFAQVECTATVLGFERTVYRNAFAFPVLRNVSSETGRAFTKDRSRPSVLLIGIDGVSGSNFLRQMPKTNKVMHELGFVTLEAYSKLGDNTFPNLCAVLLGKRGYFSGEFPAEVFDGWGINYDNWTDFIWRRFGREGYATMFSEDRPEWSTFSYKQLSKGFVEKPPTDHYQRPFFLSIYDSAEMLRSTPMCFDSTPIHTLQLDYVMQFMRSYREQGIPTFSFFWNVELAHEYLNTLKSSDDEFAEFFSKNTDLFNDTVIILMSDHGNRYDAIRETLVGRLESRLPLMSIKLPELLTRQHPHLLQNLRRNAKIFTTHFDTHEMLNDLLKNSYAEPSHTSRGFSLLGEVPENRTCQQTNVPDSYCPCYHEVSLNVSKGVEAANFLLSKINQEIQRAPEKEKCINMELDEITSLSVRLPSKGLVFDNGMARHQPKTGLSLIYRIAVRAAAPSNALLEAVLHRDLNTNTWSIDGDIERNNKYGNTSWCVETKSLLKLCHCKTQL